MARMAVLRALVVLLALPMVVTLKLAAPMTRRQAIVATSATALPLVLQRTAAHADSLEEIAARSNAAAQVARDQKAAAAENQGLVEAAGSAFNGLLSVGIVGVLGAAVFFASSIAGGGGTSVNLDTSRPLTEAEKRKYKNLSAAEKRKLGIKGL